MFTKYLWPLAASTLLLLAGVALTVAPFALSYQPNHSAWTTATEVGFWSGLGLIVMSLLSLAGWLAGLRQEIQRVFAPKAAAEEERPAAVPLQRRAEAPGQTTSLGQDTDEVLRRLALTVLRDLEERV
jgi:uncharacterized small protein (DUF1192 family)